MTGHRPWSAVKHEPQEDEWPPRRARTLEAWDEYWSRQRWDRRFMHDVIRPRWGRLVRKLRAPLRWRRQVMWALHRSRHGWARPDTWGLDDYLCQVIGESILYLRDHGHGFPHAPDPDLPDIHEEIEGEPGSYTNYLTYERWQEILTKMAAPLVAYRTHWDYPDEETTDQHWEREKKVMADAQDALRLVAEWLPSLWD